METEKGIAIAINQQILQPLPATPAGVIDNRAGFIIVMKLRKSHLDAATIPHGEDSFFCFSTAILRHYIYIERDTGRNNFGSKTFKDIDITVFIITPNFNAVEDFKNSLL
jgi:hypothetical protein